MPKGLFLLMIAVNSMSVWNPK